ncbi:MAG: TolC family protein [Candidatus Latescibacterota bacterium]|jgi:outer membrane protein TolC
MVLTPATQQRLVRHSFRAVVLLLLAWHPGLAVGPSLAPPSPGLADDPVLAGLVQAALELRPEVAQARAAAQAVAEQVPQVGALPDPVVSLGIQNDSFRQIQIGKMETSYLSVMGSQTFPWRGKRALRTEALTLAGRQAEADHDRVRLSVAAEVERAYVDLLLGRDQLGLLSRLEALWAQAEGLARTRYETGDGAQSDLLRAQLERTRLQQRRAVLTAEEQRRVAVLNRAAGLPLDDAVTTGRSLASLPDPVLPELGQAAADAEARSPELQRAGLGVEQSARLVELARQEYRPDLTVNAALMPRWGPFGPMWQAGLSFSLPLWTGSKQSRAVTESQLRGTAAQSGAQAVRQLLQQRVKERLAVLSALLESNRLYRSGLLIQSEATVSSTLVQYQVGRVTFASVLEALTGYLADLNGFYESVAAAQRLDIAGREVSLEPVADPGTGGMGGSAMPGAGGMGSGSAVETRPSSSLPEGTAGSGSTNRM